MMKRILLIVGLGVSFVAPAAFANVGGGALMEAKVCASLPGELGGCQMSKVMAAGGTDCAKGEALKAMIADNLADGFSADGARLPSKPAAAQPKAGSAEAPAESTESAPASGV